MKSSLLMWRPARLSLQYLMNSGEGVLGSVEVDGRGLVRVDEAVRVAGEGEAGVDFVAVFTALPTTDHAPAPENEVAAVVVVVLVDRVEVRVGRLARGEAAAAPVALVEEEGVVEGVVGFPLAPTTDQAPPPPEAALVVGATTAPCKFPPAVLDAESAYPFLNAIC